MANYVAVAATCEAVINMSRQSWNSDLMDYNGTIHFEVYTTENFKSPMSLGISLFVYSVEIDGTHRTYPPRKRDDNRQNRPQLPLNIHFMLTPWSTNASQVHILTAWMMRVIEDNTILSSGLLNAPLGDVFYTDEFVKITPGTTNNDEVLRVWDQLPTDFHLSVSYLASVLQIESFRDEATAGPVIEREIQYRAIKE